METKSDLRRALGTANEIIKIKDARISHLEQMVEVLREALDRVQVTQAARGLETR